MDREKKRLEEEHAKELNNCRTETEELEERMRQAREDSGQSAIASHAELTNLQKDLDEFNATSALARERMYSQLVSCLDMLTLHKENLETQLGGLKKHCAAKSESLAPLLGDGTIEIA